MNKVFLYLAYAITLTGLAAFMASQALPPEKSGPILAISLPLPLTMIAGLVIRYLHKRQSDDP